MLTFGLILTPSFTTDAILTSCVNGWTALKKDARRRRPVECKPATSDINFVITCYLFHSHLSLFL